MSRNSDIGNQGNHFDELALSFQISELSRELAESQRQLENADSEAASASSERAESLGQLRALSEDATFWRQKCGKVDQTFRGTIARLERRCSRLKQSVCERSGSLAEQELVVWTPVCTCVCVCMCVCARVRAYACVRSECIIFLVHDVCTKTGAKCKDRQKRYTGLSVPLLPQSGT